MLYLRLCLSELNICFINLLVYALLLRVSVLGCVVMCPWILDHWVLGLIEAVSTFIALVEDGEVRSAHGLGVGVLFRDLGLQWNRLRLQWYLWSLLGDEADAILQGAAYLRIAFLPLLAFWPRYILITLRVSQHFRLQDADIVVWLLVVECVLRRHLR